MIFTKSLSELGQGDVAIAGGKGAALGEMLRAGLPVPPGFVVLTTAFERCVPNTGLLADAQAAAERDPAAFHEKAAARFRDLAIPDAVTAEIAQRFASLNAAYVAVRSSATSEDSAAASWAGQFDTFLNTSHQQLLANIRRCWSSLFTPRALAYRQMKGATALGMSMAVVVQAMIPAEISGTAFSVHPVSDDDNEIVIEAGYGLGEAVVSGRIMPDSYVVQKKPRRIERIDVSVQSLALYGEAGGGCRWQTPPAHLLGRQKLSDDQILGLADLVVAIQEYYGAPRDIEWAFAGDRFYIVQSRPLTRKAP